MSTQLETANKLMLLQGISLIENGLNFIEFMDETPNENAFDALTILRDRFEYFRECALNEGECDLFLVKRMHELNDNVINDNEIKANITRQLGNLRASILKRT